MSRSDEVNKAINALAEDRPNDVIAAFERIASDGYPPPVTEVNLGAKRRGSPNMVVAKGTQDVSTSGPHGSGGYRRHYLEIEQRTSTPVKRTSFSVDVHWFDDGGRWSRFARTMAHAGRVCSAYVAHYAGVCTSAFAPKRK